MIFIIYSCISKNSKLLFNITFYTLYNFIFICTRVPLYKTITYKTLFEYYNTILIQFLDTNLSVDNFTNIFFLRNNQNYRRTAHKRFKR